MSESGVHVDLGEGVEIIVPWHDSGDPRRRDNLTAVREHLEQTGHPLTIFEGASVDPGLLRNRGAARSTARILVFNDADSIVPHAQIFAAVALAQDAPGLVYAFDEYVRLDVHGEPTWRMANAPSNGCVAIRRDCFDEVGGYDEAFEGYGFEDVDFGRRCNQRWPSRRVSGPLFHLWHEPDEGKDPERERLNRERYEGKVAGVLPHG